jgi:hypothetical protein
MWKLIEKVLILPPLLQTSDFLYQLYNFFGFVALTAQLAAAQKALYKEKASWLTADRSLAEEKAARQTTEQSLQTSDEARANLAWDLESVQASLTTTTSKSSALDTAVIREHEMEIKLKAAEEKLKVVEEKMKSQGQLLDSAQQALSKREFSSLALVKNHMVKFDVEILHKDFTLDDMERKALVNSANETAQHFVSLYDFSVLAESDDNNSPGAL